MAPVRPRHAVLLIGPLVTLVAVVAMLGIARIYDRIPVHPPDCGFKSAFGIPCVACGGTRSIRALADGRVMDALRFNPAVVLGVCVSVVWSISASFRYRRGDAPPPLAEQNRRIIRRAVVAGTLLLLNWIYLLFFLT